MRALIIFLCLLVGAGPGWPDTLVRTPEEFAAAVDKARPGDTIILADGIWRDADLVFDADGAEGDSITVRAQTPGAVILTGTSRLRIGGSYLKVEGLWFHRGALEGGHIVAFRTHRPAHHSRITSCAITEYNPPDWLRQYKWLSLYGTHNRVDHCYFAGKTHDGATLVVWLADPPHDIPNHHRIDHNHFGHRPRLGKNGGETIRIGTSARSMQHSYTVVEHNLFERTNGEHEIISNKSGGNTYRHNTFLEAQGALTLRHGNEAVVEANYFLGNDKPGTGGVRIIGEDHQVTGNYFAHLRGDSSRASLSIMNGIPNSPLNRYFQVKRPVIAHNTFVGTRVSVLFGLGADGEKTLLPEDVSFEDNVVRAEGPVLTMQVTPEAIRWRGNVFYGAALGMPHPDGIAWQDPVLIRSPDGMYSPDPDGPAAGKGASLAQPPLTPSEVGPYWWGAEWTPSVLPDTAGSLPDFSYVGYQWDMRPPPKYAPTLNVADFGATGDDTRDDTEAFQRAFAAAHAQEGLAVVGIPEGQFHLSGVLLMERDSLVVQGRGPYRTRIIIEKPLAAVAVPQGSPADAGLPLVQGRMHSRFSSMGGYFWVRPPEATAAPRSTSVVRAEGRTITVADSSVMVAVGDARLVWTTRSGKRVTQDITIVAMEGRVLTTKAPVWAILSADMQPWLESKAVLTEVGIEHLSVEFEPVPYSGHHLEDGYNAIFLSSVRQAWIRDVTVRNADAGFLLHVSSQVSLDRVSTSGRAGHLGLQLTDAQQVFVHDFDFDAPAIHSISCEGQSAYNVFVRGRVKQLHPCHSVSLYEQLTVASSGEPLWEMGAGAAPVLWNITVQYEGPEAMRLPAYVGELAPPAMLIGLHAHVPVRMTRAAGVHLEGINRPGQSVPSLYAYQRALRQQ